MTTTSWTVEGAVNTPVHHGYKAYHKTHFADPQISAPNNQRDKAVPPMRQEAASRAFHRDPDATQKRPQLEAGNFALHQIIQAARQPERSILAEKRKDLDMLRSYDPWGKPAPGAPRITSNGEIDARRTIRREPAGGAEGLHGAFGRPGGGAPLRTDSGHVQVALKADADIRFQKQLKKEVEATLRYKPLDGRSTPIERSVIRTESEKDRLAQESKKKTVYAQKLEQQLAEQIKREAQEAIEAKAPRPVYFPWGRDKPYRDDSGKVNGRKWALTSPDEEKQPHTHPIGVQTTPSLYDPWGRPGAGAPLRDEQGQPKVTLHGALLREQRNTQEHLLVGLGTGGRQAREVTPIIRKENVSDDCGTPKHQYYLELVEQAEQRQQRLRLQRERERQVDQHHVAIASHFLADSHHPPHNHTRRSWEQADLDEVKKKREYCAELQRSITEKERQRLEERQRERELDKKAVSVLDYMKGLA
ncbi:hypothetical protein EMCRGX_G033902 [Ephydatia muelleri]